MLCCIGKCRSGGGLWAAIATAVAVLVPAVMIATSDRDSEGDAESASVATVALTEPGGEMTEDPRYVLAHEVRRIDGETEDLESRKGEVLLIVNVASRCGFTRQYEGLEALYRDKKERGFSVLGFPANEFGRQEPGSNEEIAQFCSTRFDVTFPMYEKIVVKGEGAHPLYRQLAQQPEPVGGEPRWNFTKFLVDREGRVVARFEPTIEPDDEGMLAKIDELLGPEGAGDSDG